MFYFNFTTPKWQSSMSILGVLPKQIVGGLDKVPGDIA